MVNEFVGASPRTRFSEWGDYCQRANVQELNLVRQMLWLDHDLWTIERLREELCSNSFARMQTSSKYVLICWRVLSPLAANRRWGSGNKIDSFYR